MRNAHLWLLALACQLLASVGSAATIEISLTNNRFTPNNVTINVGDTVRFVNDDGFHDVRADDGSYGNTPGGPGWTFSRTYTTAGEFRVYCTVHSQPGRDINTNMNARIVVRSATVGVLENGVPVTGLTGVTGSETQFTLGVPAGAANLAIRTAGGTGDPDLLVRLGTPPTSAVFDCRSATVGTTEQCLFAAPSAGTYHVLVFGSTNYSGLTLTATFDTSSGTQTLTVSAAGNGSGTLSSNPAGINCGTSCSASFATGTPVTLTATPTSGSTFSGWSGDCSGTQRTCATTLGSARNVIATFSSGSLGSAVDEPSLVGFILPAPIPANANCPSGFFLAVVDDGPGAGVTAGTFGMEVLLDAPGTRVLAGGLNFGGLIDVGQVGFAGFSIANEANEQQTLNLNLTGSPSDNAAGSLPVHIRIGRRPDATTNLTVFETDATISLASAFQTSLNLPPGFYEVTVAPTAGAAGGNAEGQFFFSLTTNFVNRPGGGFQGGAVLGGYHTAHPFGGVSGFAAFCLATPHSTSIRVLSQPSYGPAGARDMRLRIQNAQQQDLVVVPGS